jgi:(p)ppGpp synthase/HD superfamily hydrolase
VLGERFRDALLWTFDLHRKQTRKGTQVPYFSHLMSVAALVLEDGGDEDEAIAALLHDALEDRPEEASAAEIERRFGARVRSLVEACTDTPEDYDGSGAKPDWKSRKEAYIRRVESSGEPHRVSIADKLHNARALLRDHITHGESLWARFTGTKDQTLWYYTELLRAYERAGAKGFMIDEKRRVVEELEERSKAT